MAGFCRVCGKVLKPDGQCPQCTTIRVGGNSAPELFVTGTSPLPHNIGPLPKASNLRRILGEDASAIFWQVPKSLRQGSKDMSLINFSQIHPRAFAHPADKVATSAFAQIPMLPDLLKKVSQLSFEERLRAHHMLNSVQL